MTATQSTHPSPARVSSGGRSGWLLAYWQLTVRSWLCETRVRDPSAEGLSARARDLSAEASEHARLREVAAPYLHELAVRTPFIVHLGVLDGLFIRYLDKIGGAGASSVPSRVGGSLPAPLTAGGKAMLAYIDPESLDVALDEASSRENPARVDSAPLHRELASVRLRGGLSTTRNGPLAAVACVGVPIFNGDDQVSAGLSLCDGGGGGPLDRYVPLLMERARRITAQLSSQPA
jgi:DNA-binding IclR family transcriptional regulator